MGVINRAGTASFSGPSESPRVLSEVPVAEWLALYVMFILWVIVCSFSFGYCVVYPSSTYGL